MVYAFSQSLERASAGWKTFKRWASESGVVLEGVLLLMILVLIVIILVLLYENAKLRAEIAARAVAMLEEWKAKELQLVRSELEKEAEEKARLMFEEWRRRTEEEIRRDAIEKSAAVVLGRVGEQLAPVLILARYGVNPKDMRFLGTPVDYVVFKGLSEGNLERIIFVEVKTGKSASLSPRERQVRDAVTGGRVEYMVLSVQEELKALQQGSATLSQ